MRTSYLGLLSRLRVLVVLGATAMAADAATMVNFNWTGASGYTAKGAFTYEAATAPVFFSETPGAGATKFVESFNISFFSPQNVLLETGSSVIGGVSSDRFFRLDFNTQTNTISGLDADVGGSNYLYFLTNLRTAGGQVVGPGVTTFNLFVRTSGTPNLDIAQAVNVTSIAQTPEPGTFGLLGSVTGISLCGVFFRRKMLGRS